MNDGRVTEHGTYQQLISNNGEFSRLDKEFGGSKDSEKAEEPTVHSESMSRVNMDSAKEKSAKARRAGAGSGKLEGRLIVKEKRTTGSVSWKGKSSCKVGCYSDTQMGLQFTGRISLLDGVF